MRCAGSRTFQHKSQPVFASLMFTGLPNHFPLLTMVRGRSLSHDLQRIVATKVNSASSNSILRRGKEIVRDDTVL